MAQNYILVFALLTVSVIVVVLFVIKQRQKPEIIDPVTLAEEMKSIDAVNSLLSNVQDLVDQIDGYLGIEVAIYQYEQVICENVGTTDDEIKEEQQKCLKAASAIYSSSIFGIVRRKIMSQTWIEHDPNYDTDSSLVAREQEFFSGFKWGKSPSPTDFQAYCEWIKEELTEFLALIIAYYIYRGWHDEIQALYDTREGYEKDSLDYIDDVESNVAVVVVKGTILDTRVDIVDLKRPRYVGWFKLSKVVLGVAKPYTSKSFPARPPNYETQKNLVAAENAAILKHIGTALWAYGDMRWWWCRKKILDNWTRIDPNKNTSLSLAAIEEAAYSITLAAKTIPEFLKYFIYMTNVLADFIILLDAPTIVSPDPIDLQDMPSLYQAQCI
jgi:hypothetical protein